MMENHCQCAGCDDCDTTRGGCGRVIGEESDSMCEPCHKRVEDYGLNAKQGRSEGGSRGQIDRAIYHRTSTGPLKPDISGSFFPRRQRCNRMDARSLLLSSMSKTEVAGMSGSAAIPQESKIMVYTTSD
jgi:hypothetical protein